MPRRPAAVSGVPHVALGDAAARLLAEDPAIVDGVEPHIRDFRPNMHAHDATSATGCLASELTYYCARSWSNHRIGFRFGEQREGTAGKRRS